MRTIIIGLDAFDPGVFERLVDQGRLPNLSSFLEKKGYSHFSVANPPQSEVSWTSIATGLNPGAHGIFDFVHRDPASYTPYVSLLPTKSGFSGTQFAPPSNARTLFDQAVSNGFPATVLWWPATFPARPESPVQTIPGLGTPDMYGKLGVGTLFTTEPGLEEADRKTALEIFKRKGKDRYSGQLKGPAQKKGQEVKDLLFEVELEMLEGNSARLKVGDQRIELALGEWSPIFEITLKVGFLYKLHALTRALLTQTSPEIRLYLLPLQIHPLHSPWRYASPQGFVKQTWQACGPFLTTGWPQDTTGLEEGCMNDDQFLDLCDSIEAGREKALAYHLQNYKEGVLAIVFDSLDRVQHMFWRDRQDVVEAWYEKLDGIVGRSQQTLAALGEDNTHLLVVSDHGFTRFDQKVHLNRWLLDNGYLTPKQMEGQAGLKNVDWSRTQAYAIGLNSIYINVAGREGQGTVDKDQIVPLSNRLKEDLRAWKAATGEPVVRQAWRRDEALDGPLSEYGPDLLVGFAPGYRASAQTGLGSWESNSLELNKDHWGADHCIDPTAVPGVLFSNRGLGNIPNPSYREFPWLAIGEKLAVSDGPTPPPSRGEDDEKVLEERLRSLGYL
ncbi:MAG TPA: alkaline phosphatase family protein [Anaerolineales bacterium]|nr:alkaline phosphatase family protein [Anaerolineales bacterium]